MTPILENMLLDDPLLSQANAAEARRRKPNDPTVGKAWVERNMTTAIGGLANIKRREPHHVMAAERFLNLYEARYGRVAPAIDMSKVRVDRSMIGNDGGMAAVLDATDEIERAERELGPVAFRRVVAVICLGVPCEDLTSPLPSGYPNRRRVIGETKALLAALDKLAELWGWSSRRAA